MFRRDRKREEAAPPTEGGSSIDEQAESLINSIIREVPDGMKVYTRSHPVESLVPGSQIEIGEGAVAIESVDLGKKGGLIHLVDGRVIPFSYVPGNKGLAKVFSHQSQGSHR